MGNCRLGFQNWISLSPSANFAASSSASSSQGPSNLAGPRLWPGWRTTGHTSEYFTLDAGAAVNWDCIALFGSNLTASATVQVSLGTTLGASDVYAGAAISAGVAPGYRQSVVMLPQTYSARYLKVALTDSSNPSSYLQIGMAYAGPLWTPARNFSYGQTSGWQDDSTFQISKGGQEYTVLQPQYRAVSFKMENATEAELWTEIAEIDRMAGIVGNVLFIPNPAGTYINQESIFGKITKSDQPARTSFGRYSKSFAMRERL